MFPLTTGKDCVRPGCSSVTDGRLSVVISIAIKEMAIYLIYIMYAKPSKRDYYRPSGEVVECSLFCK